MRMIKTQQTIAEKAKVENALAEAAVTAERCERLVDDIVFVTLCEQGMIDDVTATEHTDVFSQWEPGVAYTVGNIRTYGEKLYKCVQAHTSQEDWTPDVTPALWTEVAKPGEIPVWKQPTGAQDAYNKGDKVHYPTIDDPVYESTIDNNVWSPVDYPQGWKLSE